MILILTTLTPPLGMIMILILTDPRTWYAFMRQGAYASTVVCDITLSLFVICRYRCCPYHTSVVAHITMPLLPICQ
jgi:hypothetical protein